VNDFIDMREERHRRGVERALREAIKRDRARTKVLRMSAFGLIEMTRQRIRPSLKRSIYEDCPQCTGAGVVKTAESMSIDVMRLRPPATIGGIDPRSSLVLGPWSFVALLRREAGNGSRGTALTTKDQGQMTSKMTFQPAAGYPLHRPRRLRAHPGLRALVSQ